MTYFGLLKDLDLNSVTLNELKEIHLSNGLFQKVDRIMLSLDKSPNPVTQQNSQPVYVPNSEMCKEFYDYILEVYEDVIENSLIGFLYNFEEDVMGLDDIEARKIALNYYKEIAQFIIKDEFDILSVNNSETGFTNMKRAKKLELFNMRKEVLQEILVTQNPMPLTHFLVGDTNYFDETLISKLPIFDEILKFEASLKIMLILNEQYNFEQDDTNSNLAAKRQSASSPEKKPKVKKTKAPLLSESDAINFLIDNVFIKQAEKNTTRIS